ncbi:hypothetical protein [Streptomyces sp. NPDC048361]|uniref:alpha/beta fold hydrolase n=1 Tax=Streptomyces sp. NPDC048361 TaxID=3154720 RepID=UPI00343493F3
MPAFTSCDGTDLAYRSSGEGDGGPCPDLAARTAACFPNRTREVQPGAGHFPRLDDPEGFVAARLMGFLS